MKDYKKRKLPVPKVMKRVDSENWMSGEKEEDGDELIVMLRAALKCCGIYTQHVSEGKGAPAMAAEAF